MNSPSAAAPVLALRRLALLWLAGADLRMTLLAVPPLLPLIHIELGLDEKGVAALVTLPVLILGVGAVPGSLLVARIGARRALVGGLTLIGVTAALRGVGPSIPMFFCMTLLMGVGISVSQPTILALVRQWFPSAVTRATGTWSSGLLVGELLGASLTLPLVLPLVGGSWERALAVWAAPVFFTAGLIGLSTRDAPSGRQPGSRGWPNWRQTRVWQLGTLQSSASLVYFGTNTFLPDYLHAIGLPDLVGPGLTAVNFAQIPAAPLVGLLPWRILAHPGTTLFAGGLILAGLAGLVSEQPGLIVASACLLGFVSAYILVVCFAIPPLLARETDVAPVSAGANTISYSVAFVTSLLAGAIWDATQLPVVGFLPILVGVVVVLVVSPRLLAATARELRTPRRELRAGG